MSYAIWWGAVHQVKTGELQQKVIALTNNTEQEKDKDEKYSLERQLKKVVWFITTVMNIQKRGRR